MNFWVQFPKIYDITVDQWKGNCHNFPLTFQWALYQSANKICVPKCKTYDSSALRCVVTECCTQLLTLFHIVEVPGKNFGVETCKLKVFTIFCSCLDIPKIRTWLHLFTCFPINSLILSLDTKWIHCVSCNDNVLTRVELQTVKFIPRQTGVSVS